MAKQLTQLPTLQSIRGIAAAVVLLHHCSFYFATSPGIRLASEAIFNAHAAVVVFFVLSGFVLVRSLVKSSLDTKTIAVFYWRRIFRIFPALWLAVLFAALSHYLLAKLPEVPATSDWFRQVSASPFGLMDFLFAATGGLKTTVLPPLWSIRIELIGSAILPLLAWWALRKQSLRGAIALLMVTATILILLLGLQLPHMFYFICLANFAIGAAWVGWVTNNFRETSSGLDRICATAALIVLMLFRLVNPAWRFQTDYYAAVPSLIEGLAGGVLVAVIAARPLAASFLTRPWLVWLGDISYSLYLLHFIVMTIVAKLFGLLAPDAVAQHPNLAALGLAVATLTLTIAISAYTYRFVELPGIRLGRQTESLLPGTGKKQVPSIAPAP